MKKLLLIVICLLTYSLQSYGQNEIVLQKPPKQDSLKFERNKAISIEFGHHFLLATQSNISRYRNKRSGDDMHINAIKFPIDTVANYKNDLIIDRRYFPSLSVDFNFHDHKLSLEGSYTNFKSNFSYAEDYGKAAHFNSKEYYILLGYSYNNLFVRAKKRLIHRTRFYLTANILFQHKEREFYYYHFDAIGGGYIATETLSEQSSSIHLSIVSEVGMKLNITKNMYIKLGFSINCASYANGRYSWNYETVLKYAGIQSYSDDAGTYKKFLYSGENGYFRVVDNVFFKLGYSFCPYKKKGN